MEMEYYHIVGFLCWLLILFSSQIGAEEKQFMSAGYRATIEENDCYGIHGKLNIWSPKPNVTQGDYTSTLITIHRESLTLAAGWMVNPQVFHDNHPRLFAFYKRGNGSACHTYNSHCTEFKRVSTYFNEAWRQTSTEGGQQHEVDIKIILDREGSMNWWVKVNNVPAGYWTRDLTQRFDRSGMRSAITWGGQVYTSASNPAPMGSGKFPEEGHGKASYIQHLQYVGERSVKTPVNLYVFGSHHNLYRVSELQKDRTGKILSFYYGGSDSRHSS